MTAPKTTLSIVVEGTADFDALFLRLRRRGGTDLERVEPAVREILREVQQEGDRALGRFVERFEKRTPKQFLLTEYGGKPCKDVRRGLLDLDSGKGSAPKVETPDRERQALLKRVKQVLRDRVDEVRVGGRLRQSAACLVLNEHDLGYQMRELLSAAGHKAPAAIPSLELNLDHALVRRLDAESDPARFERLALLLFEQAVLAEGRQLDDPAAFVARLNELLTDLGGQSAP